MNQEVMMLKGQLADCRHRFQELDIEAKGLIIMVRTQLNPFEEDITQLKVPEAGAAMKRLQTVYTEMATLKKRIADMEEALK
jgi:hypothetical protein